MSKQKLMSIVRKAVIVGLLVLALLLGQETGYFTGLGEKLRPAASAGMELTAGTEPGSAKANGSVQPLAAVVCLPEGGRFGAVYDGETVMAVLHRFSADLGEALGSAGAPTALTEETFFSDYLSGCGVFLRFYCPQPLELLTAWLGAEMGSTAAAHRAELLFLRTAAEGVTLCYRTETGDYYCCDTAVSPEGLRSRAVEYVPNSTCFAYENELLSGCDGCTVVPEGTASAVKVKSGIPLPAGAELDELLQAMGMNVYVASSYSEADGTVVFVDEEATLRLSPSGNLYFRRSVLPAEIGMRNLTSAVSAAWQTAERSVGRSCGDAELILTGLSGGDTQRSVTVQFDYAVDGIPVRLASGHAAEIVMRDNQVIQARLNFRRCTRTEETALLLPFLQANAIAGAEQADAALVYADPGETMNCIWVKADG